MLQFRYDMLRSVDSIVLSTREIAQVGEGVRGAKKGFRVVYPE